MPIQPSQISPDQWDQAREEFIRDEPGDVDAMWARFSSSLPQEQRTRQAPMPVRRPLWTSMIAGIAGAAVVVAAGVFGYHAWTTSSGEMASMVYTSSAMEKRQLTLPDSTHVILAPNSRLEYASQAAGASLVRLTGQAYFTVAHQSNRSFTVQANGVDTRVLGTAFQVTAYPGEQGAQVAVASGKVSVQRTNGQQYTILTPGMIGSVTDSAATVVRGADITAATAWLNDRLVFDEASVLEMLRVVGRWYGYRFQLVDSTLASRRVTTEFRTEDPKRMLVILQELLEVTMTVDDTVVTLRPRAPMHKMTDPSRSRELSPRSMEVGK